MMLYNLAQNPGQDYYHSPPTLPSPVTTKNLQEGTGL